MKVKRNKLKIILFIWASILLFILGNSPIGLSDFVLPSQGGGMIHCDLNMSENIRRPVPVNNVGEVWYRDDLGLLGKLFGTIGNGISGNGKIAACSFGPLNFIGNPLDPNDKLVIFDYYGNQIWSSGWWFAPNVSEHEWSLNLAACSSSPMIDINNRVVACDNQKIILVNASNYDNVQVEWISYLSGGLPVCPSIVENKSIVLPCKDGPIYLFDVETGAKLAEKRLGMNITINPYWGIPEMSMNEYLDILWNYTWYSICPYRYNSTTQLIEWNLSTPFKIMPIKKNIFKDGDLYFWTKDNYVTVIQREGLFNWTILANNSIEGAGLYTGEGFFSTINSACVKGNRVYVATEYMKPSIWSKNHSIGRLYAIEVNPDAENESDRLMELWNYSYFGRSQATPTLINDTIYFDGYNDTWTAQLRDPHIYAVYTNGTEKWKISYPNITWFTFTTDPRGGFWYEDADQWPFRPFSGGNKLVHFREEDGNITEVLVMKELLNDTGPNWNKDVIPSSDMTICGNATNPIMLISANHPHFYEGKWVLAVNLTTNKTIWKVPVNHSINFNYAPGGYTILVENNQSRILFPTFLGGVMAIGTFPNTSFQNIGYSLKDSSEDYNIYDDTVQVNYTITSVIPDRVFIKAMLKSVEYPIICRYFTEKHYNVTPAGLTDSLNITLPSWAPSGSYLLQVFLYNSSGGIKDIVNNLLNKESKNKEYANETYEAGPFSMYPLNDPPEVPQQPWIADVINNHMNIYATNSTDPNEDNIWYQWRYDSGLGTTYYTRWVMGGPYESGENCFRPISWWFPGEYQVQVRAKDNLLQPDVFSTWSEPLNVTVTANQGAPVPWNNELLGQFTQTLVTPAQQTSCTGLAEGVYIQTQTRESLNWNWSFGDGTYSEEQNVTHNYSAIGTYVVNLTLENGQGDYFNCTINISVVNLKSDFNIIGGQPGTNISYSDISSGVNSIVNWTWDFGDGNNSYQQNPIHVYATSGIYNVSLTIKDNQNNTHLSTQTLYIESLKPQYVSVVDYPDPVGFGQNVTIEVNIFDNLSGIKAVYINITYPDNETTGNFSMEANMSHPCDYIYVFKDIWQTGIYNYSIWVIDNANNTNCTSGFDFTVSAEATITVCTTKDNYTSNEYINLTDPPGTPLPSLGYELLDDETVLHLWNQYDNYYFNTSSGIQLTNHKDEYWSHNVLMLGYYNNEQWNLLYRTDELTGFNRDIEIDENSYVNVTLWKDLSYAGYPFRLAIRYNLGINDCDLTVIPYIKNLGTTSIPYVLGFGWELKDIQVNMTTEGDYIIVDGESYYLNQTLDNVYTDIDESVFYLMDDSTETQTQSLYVRWDPDRTYKLQVKSRVGQQNAPVTLFIRVGTLAAGQQKFTQLQWYDASQETYYFDAFDANEIWENDPELMTDETEETFASTRTDTTIELCNGNTCEGDNLGTIQKVELRVNGYYEGENGGTIILRPIFGKTDGENYTFVTPERPEWSQWFDITNDGGRGGGGLLQWSWSEVDDLDCDVDASVGAETTLFCSMIQLRVTYNTAPSVSNPYPPHGTNGITLQPRLNITVSDPNGDTMNVTWYTNSTPSLLTLRPNANGSITELLRYPTSQNANYKCVDDTIVNDNDYVYWSGTSWKKDSYNLADHGSVSGVIHGVTVYARCNRGGFGQFPSVPNEGKIVIRSSGSYYYGNEFAPTSTFTYYSHTWVVNPATGYAWNWSAIDALQAGISFIGNEGGSSKCSQVYVVVNYTNPNTWYQFGQNSSISNGVYRQQLLNASVNGQWWYWKVKADDGTASTWSNVYKFYTGYQSKIENTGETNIKGYLLMQVQYYNETTENWIVDNDTVNETTPRIINSSCQLGLDTIFNGPVRASDLTYGTGTYRVYAAFRDSEGNILITDDEVELVSWWQFSKI
ncbi:MAG: PKD domain-containing protein [Candidatus Thermoplasmatota archaeon]|jgi:PKD repeat protein|nr:PKD domain-containing protein [Candidatus Thermoplasmatota archaeon]